MTSFSLSLKTLSVMASPRATLIPFPALASASLLDSHGSPVYPGSALVTPCHDLPLIRLSPLPDCTLSEDRLGFAHLCPQNPAQCLTWHAVTGAAGLTLVVTVITFVERLLCAKASLSCQVQKERCFFNEQMTVYWGLLTRYFLKICILLLFYREEGIES